VRIGITCYPSFGGSGVLATELGLMLARRGHSVHFITYETPFRLADRTGQVVCHEVDIPSYPLFRYPPYLLALTNKMIEVARFCRLDLLHVHYAIPHATSAVLARQVLAGERQLRVVTTLHGTDVSLLGSDPGFYDLVAWSINSSDGVTAVSQALARDTRMRLPITRPIEVIPNFVDTAVYRPHDVPELRSEFAPGGEAMVCHISNFRAVKRPLDVVRAFAGIAARTDARLVLIGEGPEIPRVRALVSDLGIEPLVVYLGQREQVAPVLAACDLFLLTSEQESFGLAALEAMACGVPVLAYRVGGLPEVIADGQGGFLFPDGDLEGMTRVGAELLQDRALWNEVSAAGVSRARTAFASDRIVPVYEEYYARVLEGNRREEA